MVVIIGYLSVSISSAIYSRVCLHLHRSSSNLIPLLQQSSRERDSARRLIEVDWDGHLTRAAKFLEIFRRIYPLSSLPSTTSDKEGRGFVVTVVDNNPTLPRSTKLCPPRCYRPGR